MRKEYLLEDFDYDPEINIISADIQKNIIIKYLSRTYYWTIGFFMFIVGFLVGVIVR
jgi:hypothetical protein